ncbi:DUF2975 domain-containing protein [Flagellimonas sp.]|uniref:DUF2975 domain-containing protein n=1 Tax=Flagellimonas sp. TaxID=2058762 RepID=UPI003B51AA42
MKKINYLGKKSLSVWLLYLVNFLWYSQLVILGLVLLKFIANSFSPQNTFSWPVSFVTKVQEDISAIDDGIIVNGLELTKGRLLFDTTDDWHANVLMLLGVLIIALPFLVITLLIRKILTSFASNDPFLKSNLKRIRSIGTILLVYPIVAYFFGIGYTWFLNAHFRGYEFVNSVELWPLFFGFLMLVLSEIFRIGIEYREDNNLTI